MEIKLYEKDVYGRPLLYPNCEKSKILCELLELKSIPDAKLNGIRKLGYTINITGNKDRMLKSLSEKGKK